MKYQSRLLTALILLINLNAARAEDRMMSYSVVIGKNEIGQFGAVMKDIATYLPLDAGAQNAKCDSRISSETHYAIWLRYDCNYTDLCQAPSDEQQEYLLTETFFGHYAKDERITRLARTVLQTTHARNIVFTPEYKIVKTWPFKLRRKKIHIGYKITYKPCSRN